jgi:2',3'-cyclic-nucleotide 2'-phosphodiesterase (5'-nucleotidase family)
MSRVLRLYPIILLLLVACAPKIHQLRYEDKSLELFSYQTIIHPIDDLIRPYRESLEKEMNAEVGIATCTMAKFRPESPLGNFVADLLQEYAEHLFEDSLKQVKIITMLNNGGLRAPINEGQILLRNVYELMPFDNVIVFVKVGKDKYSEIIEYLEKTGGEPIAGFRKGDVPFESDFWIVTSDYLASGGDKMTFFQNPIMLINTGRLLRDEIESYIRRKGVICAKLDGRWY